MSFSTLIGYRLREERERLGLSQADAAAIAQVRREMWSKYERGVAEPGITGVVHFGAHGADVNYILTGVRSNIALTKREEALLDNYRHCDEHGQRVVEAATCAAAQPTLRSANSGS